MSGASKESHSSPHPPIQKKSPRSPAGASQLFGPNGKPNFVPLRKGRSPCVEVTIICLGLSLLAGSGERPVVPICIGALALAPERVCRAALLPARERCNSGIFRYRHTISLFTLNPDVTSGSVLSLWHFPWVYDGTSGTGRKCIGLSPRERRVASRSSDGDQGLMYVPRVMFVPVAVSRPPLAALHDPRIAPRNGVRTFLPNS
jgi:hypothetical protein